MIEDFWNELNEGEIHLRDSLQFELKSEFYINPRLKENVYKQEVFLFIPSSLQINPESYSKTQFYLDQTNLIRYKTPPIPLPKLIDPNYSFSPLNRLHSLLDQQDPKIIFAAASDELKLFGAIFRATLRERIYKVVQNLKQSEAQVLEKNAPQISVLCTEISQVCHQFRQLQDIARQKSECPQLARHFRYVDEFISTTIEEFLIILLKQVRTIEQQQSKSDSLICQLILKEKQYRKKNNISPRTSRGHLFANESILYRHGLLNRFVMESLMLHHHRFSLEEKHAHLLGAMAAGIAMFVYMFLFVFVWKSPQIVANSFPFIAFAVFIYILKDRIKEGFKTLYYKQAYRWFPDYSTEIRSPKGVKIGKLTENFTFIDSWQLPAGFLKIRNHHFHEELQALQRQETIIQYKREMTLNPLPPGESRRGELTAIFRLNIHQFLQKASDAFQSNLVFDAYTQEITERLLPKVYHLNLIIRNTYLQSDLTPKVEINTFRVIVDKAGIKRVEHIKSK